MGTSLLTVPEKYSDFKIKKERLAQGISNSTKINVKQGLKTDDVKRSEIVRLLPYHMHLSTDLVELIHNVCAMFILAPVMAKQAHMNISVLKNLNRHYAHRLESYVRQCIKAHPETSRDVIMHCLLVIKQGHIAEVKSNVAKQFQRNIPISK